VGTYHRLVPSSSTVRRLFRATLGLRLTSWLVELGLSQGFADAIGAVVTIITYASLIVGELVPKQIALRDPDEHRWVRRLDRLPYPP